MTTVTSPHRQGRLAHVALRTPDVARAVRFYASAVGLVVHAERPGGAVELGWGRGHHALELLPGASGLDHFALELSADDPLLDRGELQDPDGNAIRLLTGLERGGEAGGAAGHRPLRVQHITLASAQVGELVEFYVDVLGMRVSDRIAGDRFVWLRSDVEHHTVAVVAADRPGLDHYSYDVEDWAAFRAWSDQLAGRGVPLSWGPGRHGPGNNLFLMFDDPDGVHVELSAEMERYWDDRAEYAPRVWDAGALTTNLWGPHPSWRTHPATTSVGA